MASKEIILCESIVDALTFWCAGFRNVTASYGVNGFTGKERDAESGLDYFGRDISPARKVGYFARLVGMDFISLPRCLAPPENAICALRA